MRRTLIGIIGMVAGLGALASVALADHEEPKKAKTYKVELLTAYNDCTGGSFSTDPPGLILPACSAVRSDPTCGFFIDPVAGPKGSGKCSAKLVDANDDGTPDDIESKCSLAKLTDGCDNEVLTLVANTNATSNDCSAAPGSSCSVGQATVLPDFAIGTCLVDSKGNKCKMGPVRVNSFAGTTVLEAGKNLGLEILNTKVKRGGLVSFRPGILIP